MAAARDRTTDRLRILAWAAILVAGIFFMTAGGTYPGIASVQARIVAQVLSYAILGGWLVLAIMRPAWRPTTPLFGPVMLASGAYAVAALFSQRPRLSLEPTLAGFGFALAFLFLTRLLARPWFGPRIAAVMILGTAIAAVGYIIQVTALWVEWWGLVGAVALPPLRPDFAGFVFGSPNLVATFLFIVGPLAVVLVHERTGRRWIAMLLAVASAIAVFLTGSRGAYLGAALAVVVAVVLAAERVGPREMARRTAAAFRQRPLLLLPLGGVVIAVAVFVPVILYRFGQGGESLRIDLWRSALSIFAEHPLTGGGPGTWVQLKVPATPPGVPNIVVPHAHSMYVQAAAELGVIGLVALAILIIAVGRRLYVAWRARREPLALQAGAVIVGLAAFAGQSLVDNLVNLPFVCLELLVVVAWVDAGLSIARDERGDAIQPSILRRFAVGPALSVVALGTMVALILPLAVIDRAALEDIAGNDAALAGGWPRALTRYDAALAADPDFTLYQLQRASALARVGRAQEARDQLAHAVEADQVAINLIGLASLDAAAGDLPAAMTQARKAVELAPFNPTVALNAGLVGEAAGDLAFTLDQFANAVAWDPPLASSGFWTSHDRSVSKADVIDAARAKSDPLTAAFIRPLTAALIRAYAGDPATARTELKAQPPSSTRDVYIAAATWLGGDAQAAQAALAAMTAADPRDWFAAAWMARISGLSGDTATGDRYKRWATIVQGDVAPFVVEEASVVPADPGDATAGLPVNYPWAVYLRPITPYLLVPHLTLIGNR